MKVILGIEHEMDKTVKELSVMVDEITQQHMARTQGMQENPYSIRERIIFVLFHSQPYRLESLIKDLQNRIEARRIA